MKVYRSRIGWELWGPTIALFALIVYKSGAAWPVVVALFLVGAFICRMVLNTVYIVSDKMLIIKCWPLIYVNIDIDSIHRIRRTWNPISSPAASYLGRIEIHYANGKSCIISPKDRKNFIAALREKNRSILAFEA